MKVGCKLHVHVHVDASGKASQGQRSLRRTRSATAACLDLRIVNERFGARSGAEPADCDRCARLRTMRVLSIKSETHLAQAAIIYKYMYKCARTSLPLQTPRRAWESTRSTSSISAPQSETFSSSSSWCCRLLAIPRHPSFRRPYFLPPTSQVRVTDGSTDECAAMCRVRASRTARVRANKLYWRCEWHRRVGSPFA